MTNRIVLLVEDELTLRTSMARGLGKLDGVEVAEAGTAREANRCSCGNPRRSSSRTSISRMAPGSRSRPSWIAWFPAPIVFVSAFVGRFRSRIPTRADVGVGEAGLRSIASRALVEDKLGVGDDAAPSPFGVARLRPARGDGSTLGGDRSARAERTRKDHDPPRRAWSASDRLSKGLEAFPAPRVSQSAQVTCKTLAHRGASRARHRRRGGEVLLDAARAFDEHERTSVTNEVTLDGGLDDDWEAAFSEAPVTKTSARSTAVSFEDAYDRGVDALLHKDHAAAYAAFVESESLLARRSARGREPHPPSRDGVLVMGARTEGHPSSGEDAPRVVAAALVVLGATSARARRSRGRSKSVQEP